LLKQTLYQVSGRFEKSMTEHGVTITEWLALRTLYNKTQSIHAELIEALEMRKSVSLLRCIKHLADTVD
jgi:DNA-binding MarR family transcriptional regulator